MKIYVNIFVLALVVMFSSCKDWLDVTPDGQATEGDLFSSGNGYRSVLNGLYKAMGNTQLYGMDLTYGMIDCMAQMYDLETNGAFANEKYKDAQKFDYKSSNLSGSIEDIWAKAYNIIANANALIQNIQNASDNIFAEGEMERKMILGEAFACRALIHFELLRLFAPALVNDDGRTYIPYINAYPTLQTGKLGVKPVLEKVITDLKTARELTAVFDTTVVGRAVNIVGTGRFWNLFEVNGASIDQYIDGFQSKLVDDFFKGRGYRLNYYAVTALLARVCQYAGMEKDAFDYAEEVVGFKMKLLDGREISMFKDDFSGIMAVDGHMTESFEKRSDLKMVSNLIFAAYDKLAYERDGIYKTYWTASVTPNWFQISDSYFKRGDVDESETDYRWRYLMYMGNYLYPVSGKWYPHQNDVRTQERCVPIFPVIRATEMQYIMAEYYARNGNIGKAYEILNAIREARGIRGSSLSGSSWAEFQADLIHDARREWISEGQMFYLYKRLNAGLKIGDQVRPMTRDEYLLPVPADIK